MALTSWSTSNYLSRSAAVWPGALPFYTSTWINVSRTATFRPIFSLGTSGQAFNKRDLYLEDSNFPNCRSCDGAACSTANLATLHPASTWFHMAGSWVAAADRFVYQQTANFEQTTSHTVGAPVNTFVGRATQTTLAFENTGAIAEVSVWDTTGFSAANRDSLDSKLNSGQNPINIRNESSQPWTNKLVAYWPLVNTTDINDTSGNGHNLTMVGTLTDFGSHPTIDPVSGGGGRRRLTIMGVGR